MSKHQISATKLAELQTLQKDYAKKYSQKVEQIEVIRSGTIDFQMDPTYQSLIERRDCYQNKLNEIEEILSNYELIEQEDYYSVAQIGTKVKILNHSHSHEFILVDEAEADPSQNKVPVTSPIGAQVLGKKVEDKFKVETPRGVVDYTVMSIEPAFM
ncbi:GreA/GreB family elongation factor [Candidatus Dojkabacteria bacterium]|uniref:GreA/GreB family elongation factor n=1 Tax=Candidatus Dojkabacteria bacterium TaxID=2099670 RepID=A0A955L3D8_9BACT|nr:GreA/GreB family elongation factor [Candidatus Dojkabacteria bacterium]